MLVIVSVNTSIERLIIYQRSMYTFAFPSISNGVLLILTLISMEHLQIVHRRSYWNDFVTSTLVVIPTINSRELVNAFGEGCAVRNISLMILSHMCHINSRVR